MIPFLSCSKSLVKTIKVYSIDKKSINYILNNYPVYWNTYLLCEDLNNVNIKIYNHLDINEYVSLIQQAIDTTVENVNHFISIV